MSDAVETPDEIQHDLASPVFLPPPEDGPNPHPDPVFVANPETGGTTQFVQKTEENGGGFFLFVAGQPGFFPTSIAKEMAQFILDN